MEKSIENIWVKGFMDSEESNVPKVTDLYNKKSELLLDKMKQTYTKDNKSTLFIAAFLGLAFGITGHILLGIYTTSLLVSLYFFNKKMLLNIENIEVYDNNYKYLTTYRKGIRKIINTTTKLLGFGLPIVIIPGYWLFFRNTEMYRDLLAAITPLQLLLGLIAFVLIVALLAIFIYKITTKTLYGDELQKLDKLISDMDKLNSI